MLNRYVQRLAGLAVVISYTGAYLVEPTTNAAADTASDCSSWQVVDGTENCDDLAASWLITATAFSDYNPSVGSSCKLVAGNSYCVERNWGLTPETPTSSTPSTSASPTPTTPSNGITTPSPIQMGMVNNCNKFYLVIKDDTCYDIASKSSISLDQLYLWNPAIGDECKALWPANYICVGVIGGSQSPIPSSILSPSPTPKPSSKPSPTTSPNGVNTPSPIQSGMTSNCDQFYLVKDNDGCYDIAKKYGITLDQFYAWNPAVGNTCAALWPTNYVCVSIIGVNPTTFVTKTTLTSSMSLAIPPPCTFDLAIGQYVCPSRTPTPAPTKPGSGIATPTPIQSGMTTKCEKFHKVVKNDGCWAIANTYKIDLNDFYKWNPGVGSSCATLGLDYYVCVAV